MSNAKNRIPNVTMETAPFICGGCKRKLNPLQIEELAGFFQLRIGDILIIDIEASCTYCGWKFRWKIRESDIPKMILTYEQIVDLYRPE